MRFCTACEHQVEYMQVFCPGCHRQLCLNLVDGQPIREALDEIYLVLNKGGEVRPDELHATLFATICVLSRMADRLAFALKDKNGKY